MELVIREMGWKHEMLEAVTRWRSRISVWTVVVTVMMFELASTVLDLVAVRFHRAGNTLFDVAETLYITAEWLDGTENQELDAYDHEVETEKQQLDAYDHGEETENQELDGEETKKQQLDAYDDEVETENQQLDVYDELFECVITVFDHVGFMLSYMTRRVDYVSEKLGDVAEALDDSIAMFKLGL